MLKILTNIKKSHIFTKCNGLVITNITTHGDFNLDHYYERTEVLQIIEDLNNLFENNLNILYGFPIGHCVNKLTIPINSELTIDCKDGTMTFTSIN